MKKLIYFTLFLFLTTIIFAQYPKTLKEFVGDFEGNFSGDTKLDSLEFSINLNTEKLYFPGGTFSDSITIATHTVYDTVDSAGGVLPKITFEWAQRINSIPFGDSTLTWTSIRDSLYHGNSTNSLNIHLKSPMTEIKMRYRVCASGTSSAYFGRTIRVRGIIEGLVVD